jgi:ABC-type thiamine transport system substrate-binding protein
MYPVLPSVALPDSYRAAVRATKTLDIDPKGLTDEALEAVDILVSGK